MFVNVFGYLEASGNLVMSGEEMEVAGECKFRGRAAGTILSRADGRNEFLFCWWALFFFPNAICSMNIYDNWRITGV